MVHSVVYSILKSLWTYVGKRLCNFLRATHKGISYLAVLPYLSNLIFVVLTFSHFSYLYYIKIFGSCQELFLGLCKYYLLLILSLAVPAYKPNHAAPAPTITEINPDCSSVGSGKSMNHIVE